MTEPTVRSPSPLRLLGACVALAALGGVSLAAAPRAGTPPAGDVLTSRPRPADPAVEALAVGKAVRTGPTERRRLRLPDGSVLYVNRQTRLRVQARDRVILSAGEVFVEVAPHKGPDLLTVKTPKREVKARGTKFALRAGPDGTSVLVAAGRVTVSGLDAPVRGGQILPAGADVPASAPRVSALLGWTRELMSAGGSLVPASQHAGGALVARDPDGQEAKLTLRRYHVDVHVEDGFARTTIDQTYFNHSTERLEGTFYFPLPPDASLSRLAMYVAGRRMEGGMAERDWARSVYERIVYQQKDPALLEWVDGSTFKMRVFPLEGRQEKRIVLSYVQKLQPLYGRAVYRFPAGHSLGRVQRWSLHARVKDGAGRSWASPSHALKKSKSGADLVLTGELRDAPLDRDVVLELADGTKDNADAESVLFSKAEQDGARYLMVRFRLGLRGEKVRQRRDWVFLVETSGDRDPLLARTQIEVVRSLLHNAEPDDTFAVLTAGTRTRALDSKARPVTPVNVEAAVRFLEKAHLIGALDLGRALNEVKPYLTAGKAPYLVHLGTGIAAMGERRQDVLVKRLPEGVRYVGVGVGRRWNRALMRAAAERTAGYFTQVNPDEPLSWRGFDLAATLSTPRLLDVSVTDGGKRAFLPFGRLAAQGEELAAVLRVQGEEKLPEKVVVKGTLAGKPFVRELAVGKVREKAGYLPRAWAKLEIDRLLAEDAVKHKGRIVALSKAMYVMSPFTSLLVLESEEMYRQFKVDRGRKDHWATYECPAKIKVVYEPLEGETAEERRGKKPAAKEVADTLLRRDSPTVLHGAAQLEARKRPLHIDSALAVIPAGRSRSVDRQTKAIRAFLGRPSEKETVIVQVANGDPGAGAGFGTGKGEGMIVGEAKSMESVILRAIPKLESSENLEMIQRGRPPVLSKIPYLDRLLRNGVDGAEHSPSLLYQRPAYSADDRLFYDLLAYAPGLNTSAADIRAVLEAEAHRTPASRPGKIDAGARKLFARARAAGWRTFTIPAEGDHPAVSVTFDGAGRHASQRTLPSGLRERVVCDGKTLWHAYPDLGLASRRTVSRFHRLDFAESVPWALPAPEDLARGADLRLIGDDTVALVPHGAGGKGKDGKVPPHNELHFIFATERLAERRLVRMPGKKVLWRETYSADGVVKHLDAKGKTVTERKGKLAEAEAPALKPALDKLVVLELPFRSRQYVRKTYKIEKRPYAELPFAQPRALLAADVAAGDANSALAVFQQALHGREQKELGYYVLLAAAGQNLDSEHADVLGEHPDDPLAQYLALHPSAVLRKHASQWAAGSSVWGAGFLQRLAQAHALLQRWQAGKNLAGTPLQRRAERRRALAFVRKNKGSPLGWALLGLMQDRTDEEGRRKVPVRDVYKELAGAWQLFEDAPGLGGSARYERARCLFKAGQGAEARKVFRALHARALKDGRLLRVDADFRSALLGSAKGEEGWGALMRRTAGELVKQKKRAAVLTLARQCWQLDDQPLAQQLFGVALADLPAGKEGLPLRLAGVQLLWQTGEVARADRLLHKLLEEPGNARRADLWRLAYQVAQRRDRPARQLECLEKFLDLEYRNLPPVINLQTVREDYEKLLGQYESLARALRTLKLAAPAGFQARVVRAADRWRALDRDGSSACALAARVLQLLGARELAWDYLTTPVALKPAESAPWSSMAEELKRTGELALADRAFQAAFEAEPTNAQLLWDRAQNLRQAGRFKQMRSLYRQLAEGDWQPRFRGLQEQARWQLEGS
jgi:hypothetical protein